ncbi:MAG: hypothetical protein Q9212_007192 [Teloschistes hypoglaucus]
MGTGATYIILTHISMFNSSRPAKIEAEPQERGSRMFVVRSWEAPEDDKARDFCCCNMCLAKLSVMALDAEMTAPTVSDSREPWNNPRAQFNMTSTSRLDGKVALVTGSGHGMGRQNAIELAKHGASLVVNYTKSASAAVKVVSEIEALGAKAIAIRADVSQPAEIVHLFERAMQHYGHLDIVVSNSGVESFGHISGITPEEFDRVFMVNTRGQFLVAQQAYKHLTVGGRLIMLSSISASAKGVKDHSIYSGSQGAVDAFARCLAVGE